MIGIVCILAASYEYTMRSCVCSWNHVVRTCYTKATHSGSQVNDEQYARKLQEPAGMRLAGLQLCKPCHLGRCPKSLQEQELEHQQHVERTSQDSRAFIFLLPLAPVACRR